MFSSSSAGIVKFMARRLPGKPIYFSLDELTEVLWNDLRTAGLGKRPIIWITHSLGGILLKKILKLDQKVRI